ncbi:hypothetical protein ACJX0J_031303 [Zea mays]
MPSLRYSSTLVLVRVREESYTKRTPRSSYMYFIMLADTDSGMHRIIYIVGSILLGTTYQDEVGAFEYLLALCESTLLKISPLDYNLIMFIKVNLPPHARPIHITLVHIICAITRRFQPFINLSLWLAAAVVLSAVYMLLIDCHSQERASKLLVFFS